MKICLVVSNAFAFLDHVAEVIRPMETQWRLAEAVTYQQAEEFLAEQAVQIVMVDDASMHPSPETFLSRTCAKYPETWFIAVGDTAYPDAMHLETPLNMDTLSFFLQHTRIRDLEQGDPQWILNYMEHIYPILLSHLWTGILNAWVLPDRTMIMMAARNIHVPYLENMLILPVLVKTTHLSKVEASPRQASKDHLFFETLLVKHLLISQAGGAALDRYEQKWAVLAYTDVYPCDGAEMASRCRSAAAEALQHDWHMSFYIGLTVTPQHLLEQWNALEALGSNDVGYSSRIVSASQQVPHRTAELPDMQHWRQMLEQAQCSEVSHQVAAYILPLAQEDRIDTAWLVRFREALLQVIYHGIHYHGIPVERILQNQLEGADFQRSVSGVPLFLKWVDEILSRIGTFLESEQPDTVVKRAQKYILQNLDQELNREDIAAHVFVSGGYLGRLFKKELGVSLSEYVYLSRMKLAAQMLEQTDMYVTSIAMQVGFSNFPYFSTQFKKYSGYTPVEYRRNVQKTVQMGERDKYSQ